MVQNMRYGFVLPNNLGVEDPHDVVRLGIRAEELGYDSAWVNHHILHLGYVKDRLDTRPYQDALVTLTWLAAQTSRIGIGTSVLVMPYLHPMALAKHLATLDQLSGGRLTVGLGAGSLPEENAALGVPYEARGRYCNEFIEVLRKLWTEDDASFAGEFFTFQNLCSSPKPFQDPHPRIVIGGNRPAALRRAAHYGDGWHPMNVSPEGVERRLEVLRHEARTTGRVSEPEVVQVRLDMARVDADSAAAYEAVGVTDLVMHVASSDVMKQEASLEEFAGLMLS
jgi:probable F420-dependent oxidoreductase